MIAVDVLTIDRTGFQQVFRLVQRVLPSAGVGSLSGIFVSPFEALNKQVLKFWVRIENEGAVGFGRYGAGREPKGDCPFFIRVSRGTSSL